MGSPGQAVIHQVKHLSQAEVPQMPSESFKSCLFGTQYVAKFNEQARNEVHLYMGIIRLRNVTTDILIQVNDPVRVNEQSSSKGNLENVPRLSGEKILGDLMATFRVN